MRVDGSFPIHVARAYGLTGVKKAHPAHKLSLSSQVSAPSSPTPINTASGINKLLAGKVNQPIDFNNTATPSIPMNDNVLSLYTRAADRIEAATSVQLGRSLDLKG